MVLPGCLALVLAIAAPPPSPAPRATLDVPEVVAAIEKDGRVVLGQGTIVASRADFTHDGETVEAIAFRRTADGRYPAVLLIPGYQRTARDLVPMGLRLARAGFAALAVTQRGFGRSTGARDYVGPRTLAALQEAFRRLRAEPHVDPRRVAIYGYSRGGMAASLLAVRMTADELKAAVFGAGIYDFRRAYDEVAIPGIRENMAQEAGLSAAAVRERSSVFMMETLPCPVLILHGDQDRNVPVSQAYLLRDRLVALNKPHRLQIFPGLDHGLPSDLVNAQVMPFLRETLGVPQEP